MTEVHERGERAGPPPGIGSLVTSVVLWPGDATADALDITSPDGRMLFRLFVNLAVYGKLGILIGLLFV